MPMSELRSIVSQVHVALDVENRRNAPGVGIKGVHETPSVREELLLSLLGLRRAPLAHHDERARVQVPVVYAIAAQRAHDLNRHALILERLLPHVHAAERPFRTDPDGGLGGVKDRLLAL